MINTKLLDVKFFRFLIVGVINTIIGSSIMFLLYNFGNINYWISSACNYFFTSILSFFLNKYFTFGIKQWSLFMIVTFILNISLSYFIAYGIAKPVMNYLLKDNSIKFRENMALFTGMCLFTVINYIGQRLVVFNEKFTGKNND